MVNRSETDLGDVFSGPVKVETETEYVIAPPPPVYTSFTAPTHASDEARNSASTVTATVTAPVVLTPLVSASVDPLTASPTVSPTPAVSSTPAAIISSTQTLAVSSTTASSASSTSVSAVSSPPTISSAEVISPANTAVKTLNDLNTSLMPELHDMMEALRWSCPNHYMLGIEEPMEHKATTCTLGKCNNSDESWKVWRKGLHFVDRCCYGCGVEMEVSFFFDQSSHAHCVLQRTFTDELGQIQRLIHVEPVGGRCPYSETLRAIAWLIYSTPTLRTAYEQSIWRNGRGLDSIPAVPFVRWLGQTDSSGLMNLYTVGFFALTLRGQPRASTSFPMF